MERNNFLEYPLWYVVETPLMEKNLLIFSGKEGRACFNKKVKETYEEWEDDGEADGLHFMDFIYIENIEENKEILFHEIAHYIDYCIKTFGCEAEPEFKARIIQFIFSDLFLTIYGHALEEIEILKKQQERKSENKQKTEKSNKKVCKTRNQNKK